MQTQEVKALYSLLFAATDIMETVAVSRRDPLYHKIATILPKIEQSIMALSNELKTEQDFWVSMHKGKGMS